MPSADALSPAEALARAGSGALLSHETAARALGIELLSAGLDRLTVPRQRSRLVIPGWQVVRSTVASADREETEGLAVTGAARTVADLASVLPTREAVVAADGAIRKELAEAEALRERLVGRSGRGAARRALVGGRLDALSGSVLESVTREVLRDDGLRPVSQHEIWDGPTFVARVDFAWPARRLAVEVDGFAFHSDRAAYRRDRERLNQLERMGWRVLRFTWEDVMSRPEHVIGLVRQLLAVAA